MCHLGERDERGVRSLFMWTTDRSLDIYFLGDIIARPNKESNLLARPHYVPVQIVKAAVSINSQVSADWSK